MARALPWLLLVFVAVVDLAAAARARESGAAKKDAGSYWVFAVALVGGYAVAFTLAAHRAWLPDWAWLGPWSLAAGAALTVAGTALRFWSIRTLGPFFTREVYVATDQPVVDRGPYRWIRHPSYTGGALGVLGIGLAMGSWVTALITGGANLAGILWRIPIEERAMIAALGDRYRSYMQRTWRLVPFLF